MIVIVAVIYASFLSIHFTRKCIKNLDRNSYKQRYFLKTTITGCFHQIFLIIYLTDPKFQTGFNNRKL